MHNLYTALNTLVCTVIVVLIVCVFSMHMPNGNTYTTNTDYSYAWNYDDGEEALPMEPRTEKGGHTITKRIYPEEVNGASLCFRSSNLFFDIKLNGELIYTFRPKLSRIYGSYYGDMLHYVTIPDFNGEGLLSIEYTPLRSDRRTAFSDMQLTDSRVYEYSILSRNFYKFIISCVVVIFGVVLVLFSIASKIEGRQRVETSSLGAFAIVMGIWTNSGTMVLQTVTNNPAAARLLDYAALMTLPVPILIFAGAFTDSVKSIRINAGLILTAVNIIGTMTAVLGFGLDYRELLITTHATVIIASGLVISVILTGRRTGERRGSYRYILSGFGIMALSGAIDLIRYYAAFNRDNAMFTRIGLMICVVILAFYELRQLFLISRRSMELEVIERMAHLDGLTGLGNRNAFIEFEKELSQGTEGKCIFVQFDINDLKKVNDTYGHSAGDDHITAATNILKETFGKNSRCFRMGGDEFLAVVTGGNCKERSKVYMDNFNDLVRAYNLENDPPVKLRVAYGMAEYDLGSGDPEDAEKLADKRMYECKEKMKRKAYI
ncbi:MAG: diguanylate cyclase [Ruminococcus sp.]|nr:diguanylate cyclase [Ruminococcus sp.]